MTTGSVPGSSCTRDQIAPRSRAPQRPDPMILQPNPVFFRESQSHRYEMATTPQVECRTLARFTLLIAGDRSNSVDSELASVPGRVAGLAVFANAVRQG